MFLLFGSFALLASGISANKILLYALTPEFLTGTRMTIAGILLGVYTLVQERSLGHFSRLKGYIPLFALVVLFTTYFPSNLKAYALAHMPSSKMAFFGTLDPFVTALYSWAVFKERLSLEKCLGIFLGFLGMIILILGTTSSEHLGAFFFFSYPELAAFWAIVLSRFGWIQAQILLKKEIVSPVHLNSIIMFLGGLLSLLAALVRKQTYVKSLTATPLAFFSFFPGFSSSDLIFFFLTYTIVIGNMVGYTLYAYALKRYSPLLVSLASFSVPLFVALLGWLFLGEQLSFAFFSACLVTFIGLMIFTYGERKKSKIIRA